MADADPDSWSLPSEARPQLNAEGVKAPAPSVRRLSNELDEELLRGRPKAFSSSFFGLGVSVDDFFRGKCA